MEQYFMLTANTGFNFRHLHQKMTFIYRYLATLSNTINELFLERRLEPPEYTGIFLRQET